MDFIVGAVVVVILGLAVGYIVRTKRRGVKCIGCSVGGCSGGCPSGCTGCAVEKDPEA